MLILGRVLAGISFVALTSACNDPAGPIPDTSNVDALQPDPSANAGGTSTSEGDPTGSGQGGSGNATPDLVSFDEEIHPILIENCGDCHNTPGGALPGHGAAEADDSFDAVHVESNGDPVYERILARTSGDEALMPPGCGGAPGTPGCLSQEEYDLIELWVEQGASNR